jgi:hypothetical protein
MKTVVLLSRARLKPLKEPQMLLNFKLKSLKKQIKKWIKNNNE